MWGSEPTKEVVPRDRLDALPLGVDVNLQGERLRLTKVKRERYAAHAEKVAKGEVCGACGGGGKGQDVRQ
jgi:hypothetical protein